MSGVLGHDVNGMPLRAGDLVIVVNPRKESWKALKGRTLTVRGIDPDNGRMVTANELPPPYATNPARLQKIHSDHLPADESFTDMMKSLKGEPA